MAKVQKLSENNELVTLLNEKISKYKRLKTDIVTKQMEYYCDGAVNAITEIINEINFGK